MVTAVVKSTLYIVATPIGNLGDITLRAIEVLKEVDAILAEDTRHSQRLLKHLSIQKPLLPLHDHNERDQTTKIITQLTQGASYALISDAGTPLISDPGYSLVRSAQEAGVEVVPIPGACSLIAALSVSGIPTDRFIFEGFLPAKAHARDKRLQELSKEKRTWIFFEAPHRIVETLEALVFILGDDREITIARELTKTFETVRRDSLKRLQEWIKTDPVQQQGEFVVCVAGSMNSKENTLSPEAIEILTVLLSEVSASQASRLASKITGIHRRVLYEYTHQLDDKLKSGDD